MSQIGEELGFTKNAVWYWFKLHGIEVKPRSTEVSCAVCGKKKSVFPRDVRRNKTGKYFCSKKCFIRWNSEDARRRFSGKSNPNYKPKVKTECANCGEPMKVHPCRIPQTGNVYCDNACQYEGMSKHFAGELSPNWRGGLTAEPYCQAWIDRDFKADIKERDGNKCQNPDCRGNSRNLCVHHIDFDKKNCHPDNLITLCVSCNARANFRRDWHRNYYREIMQSNRETHTNSQ